MRKKKQSHIEKRVPKYHKIYEQLYENPLIPLYRITENTGISRSTVSRYVKAMYAHSIVKGPSIFVKPAQNYHEYAAFMRFKEPLSAYKGLKGFPLLKERWLASGNWNILLICEKLMNFSLLKGFEDYFFYRMKGGTCLSKVIFFDWDQSMEEIYSTFSPPEEKSTLYEEIPLLPWNEKEWLLYDTFKYNVRIEKMPPLEKTRTRFEFFQEWMLALPEFALVQPAFYPKGLENYFMLDFLFKSEYQKQLADILGMLPSTCMFFSVGTYVFARLPICNSKEKDELFSLIFRLQEKGFFTDFYQATVISMPELGL